MLYLEPIVQTESVPHHTSQLAHILKNGSEYTVHTLFRFRLSLSQLKNFNIFFKYLLHNIATS